MPRVIPVQSRDQVAPEHREVFDTIAAARDNVRGPSSIILHSPMLAVAHAHLGRYLRSSLIKNREFELAIIATAREKDCGYIWAAHLGSARKAGIPEETIMAIRDRADFPTLEAQDAALVTYIRQLLRNNRVEQALFDRLQNAFGTPCLVEVTALVGHYGYLAGILNAFDLLPAPDAEQLPL